LSLDFKELLNVIDSTYNNYQKDRKKLKHSIKESFRQTEILNEQLKNINDERDKFIYTLSHDLRAPLLCILGLLEISEINDSDLKENFSLMKTSVQKLDSFILDVLDHLQNARWGIKNERIQFKTLMEEIIGNLRFENIMNKSRVKISLDIPDGVEVYSDKTRLRVILNNLVANAIQYYNPAVKDPYVEIRVTENGSGIQLVVSDNGIGISKEYHAKVFHMFYRVSKNSTGSGLGLYIVKEAVEKLSGTISIQSEQGFGTKIIIELPNQM
jgi:signal transduction histidine kinase